MNNKLIKRPISIVCVSLLSASLSVNVLAEENIDIDERTKMVPYDPSVFRVDPSYDEKPYSIEKQLEIYGGKSEVIGPRPLLELGRSIYQSGPFDEASYAFGAQNPTELQFLIYGDWRTAIGINEFNNGALPGGTQETGVIATRLNLDFDLKITSTERLHAVMTPLEKDGRFTRNEFSGTNVDLEDANNVPLQKTSEVEDDFTVDALFFEGDLGSIVSGSGNYSSWDLPFAIGLMPLLFQNGIWLDDAFTGLAVTIPAQNSKALDISNYDITFFAGFDKVGSAVDVNRGDDDVSIFGITAFADMMSGYWEVGAALTVNDDPTENGSDYVNITAAFTRRYGGWLTNSVRVIVNTGQDLAVPTADGTLIILENSLITSSPSTSIPYLNIFIGIDTPQSLARAGGAGGVLKNTGINFETDGLTGFPTLDATANQTYGFALGWNYLFALNQQLVVEFAMVIDDDDDDGFTGNGVPGDQLGIGIRYQRPLTKSWIIRADAMVASRDGNAADDLSGVRIELRKKF